MKEAILKVDL